MSFKKFLRYTTSALVIGAILILGFLAFSGIYVLAPILGLCIAAFILSVVFEGEIYYQNISKAIKSLIKPHYIESKLAEECLQEAIKNINDDCELISAIDEFIETMDIITPNDDGKELIKKYHRINTIFLRKKENSKCLAIGDFLKTAAIPEIEDINTFINLKNQEARTNGNVTSQIKFAKMKINPQHGKKIRKRLLALKDGVVSNFNPPQFFIDYAQLATIDHAFSHINPTEAAKKRKQSLQTSLSIMEQIFTEQLFPHTKPKKTSGKKWWWFRRNNEQDTDELPANPDNNASQNLSSQNLEEYKNKLRAYLEAIYLQKYNKMLPKRKLGSKFIKVLSTICATLMILGTSYLLVEAFAVVPLLAAIPFGALPAIIVPLAVLAGIAYGMQTYRALDEILNSDVITQRIAKIKADIKNGLTFYTGAKLFVFVALLGLAITLTICTGGTWYTILKHTKPLFSWLSKIPGAVIGVIAGLLAVASFAFNISNSAQTAEELEEAIESQVAEDNPYNIDLIELADDKNIEEDVQYVQTRTAIIKQGDKYFIHCCPAGQTQWQRLPVRKNSFLLKALLNRFNFNQNILYHSTLNSGLYSLIRSETAHKFNPSKENWTQFFNPFRIILLFTYVPIRIVFFLGHLASISATSDRIPGIPDVISMMIGFVAELFEDLHYFTSFNHTHKADLPAIVTEHFKEEDNCDHANDLPTRVLRDWIFYPVFMGAAWWHSHYNENESRVINLAFKALAWLRSFFSQKETTVERTINPKEKQAISYEDALQTMRGKKPKINPQLDPKNEYFVKTIETHLEAQEKSHKNIIDDQEDLITIPSSGDELITTLIAANKASYGLRIFSDHKNCACHPAPVIRNQVLRH